MQHWDWVGNGEWPNAALRENRNAWNYDSSACPGNISSARSAKASCGVHDTIERRWRPTVAKLVYRPPDLRARCFVGSAHCPRSRVSGRGHPPCSPGRTASFRSPRPRTLLPCRNTTPAELQSSLMRLAIDAITQAEGAAPAAVAPPPPSAPATVATPATPLPTPPTQTQPPQPPPTPQQPAQPTQQPQIVAAPAPTSTPMPVDGQTPDGHDVNTSGAPPAQKNATPPRPKPSSKRRWNTLPPSTPPPPQNPTNGSLTLPSSLHSQDVIAPPLIPSSKPVNKGSTS
jgi:hypothetical protein